MPVEHGPLPSADALFDHAACGLLLARPDGTIVRANATFCAWVGFNADELLAKRVQDLMTVGARVFHQTHWQPLLHMQGSVSEIKVDVVRKDGRRVPVLVNTIRRAHDGVMYDELAFFVATDRDKYEQELLRARGRLHELNAALAEADRRKDEFLATLAHELRNPLAPIRNVLHILTSGGTLDQERLGWSLDILDRQIGHMTRLVDDLLEIARIAQGKIELRKTRVDLIGVLTVAAETARPLMETAGVSLTLQLPAGRVFLEADETRLSQILQNLLTNAAKYTPRGGKVVLSAERGSEAATIRVRDTGIGIAAEDLSKVFDMFAQVASARTQSHGGLGIGLALVRGLVELHGGTVAAVSDGVDKGSEVSVTLPASIRSAATATESETRAIARSPRKILVVDDNADAVESLSLLLSLQGHDVRATTESSAVLSLAAEFAPAIVILDIGMPGMDGHEVARRIRSQPWGRSTYLVALTGWGQEQDRRSAIEAGFDIHFTKPLTLNQLDVILEKEESRAR
jgi:PAS domain S-box-containing protein